MKAICIQEPGKVVVKNIDRPVREQGEALLRVLYGGICGSDLGTYRGSNAYASYPRVPGHEFSAEIVEVGDNNRGLKTGMIVTCNPYFNCGNCYSCRRGLVNACAGNQTMGVQREGAFAEFITMPVERVYDGKGLDPKRLALIEPFCIGYHGISRGNVRNGDRVLVMGAGTIGVLAAVAAKAKGAEVTICDVAPEKLEYARVNFGLDHALLNSSAEDFMRKTDELTGGDGFDVTVEAVGLPQTFQRCLDAVCFGGRVVQIGVSKRTVDAFFFTIIQKKELNIFGSRNALKGDFLELIDWVKKDGAVLDKIVTNTYRWTDAPEAFADFDANAGEMLKVLLDFT